MNRREGSAKRTADAPSYPPRKPLSRLVGGAAVAAGKHAHLEAWDPLPRYIVDSLAPVLPGPHFKCLVVLWRLLHGYERPLPRLSAGLLAKRAGVSLKTAKRGLAWFSTAGLIYVKSGGRGRPNVVRLYEQRGAVNVQQAAEKLAECAREEKRSRDIRHKAREAAHAANQGTAGPTTEVSGTLHCAPQERNQDKWDPATGAPETPLPGYRGPTNKELREEREGALSSSGANFTEGDSSPALAPRPSGARLPRGRGKGDGPSGRSFLSSCSSRDKRKHLEKVIFRKKIDAAYFDGRYLDPGEQLLEAVRAAALSLAANRGFELAPLTHGEIAAYAFARVRTALPVFQRISDFERRRRVVTGAVVNAVVDAAMELSRIRTAAGTD